MSIPTFQLAHYCSGWLFNRENYLSHRLIPELFTQEVSRRICVALTIQYVFHSEHTFKFQRSTAEIHHFPPRSIRSNHPQLYRNIQTAPRTILKVLCPRKAEKKPFFPKCRPDGDGVTRITDDDDDEPPHFLNLNLTDCLWPGLVCTVPTTAGRH